MIPNMTRYKAADCLFVCYPRQRSLSTPPLMFNSMKYDENKMNLKIKNKLFVYITSSFI